MTEAFCSSICGRPHPSCEVASSLEAASDSPGMRQSQQRAPLRWPRSTSGTMADRQAQALRRFKDTDMRVCNQDGSSVYYRSHGNGEPVLLIHGLGGSGVDWALQIPALEKRFRVIAPDLPGCAVLI